MSTMVRERTTLGCAVNRSSAAARTSDRTARDTGGKGGSTLTVEGPWQRAGPIGFTPLDSQRIGKGAARATVHIGEGVVAITAGKVAMTICEGQVVDASIVNCTNRLMVRRPAASQALEVTAICSKGGSDTGTRLEIHDDTAEVHHIGTPQHDEPTGMHSTRMFPGHLVAHGLLPEIGSTVAD